MNFSQQWPVMKGQYSEKSDSFCAMKPKKKMLWIVLLGFRPWFDPKTVLMIFFYNKNEFYWQCLYRSFFVLMKIMFFFFLSSYFLNKYQNFRLVLLDLIILSVFSLMCLMLLLEESQVFPLCSWDKNPCHIQLDVIDYDNFFFSIAFQSITLLKLKSI